MDKEWSPQKDIGPETLLEEYGALLREMEGTLESFEDLHADIRFAMDDIYYEMERLQEYLDECASALRAYSRQEYRKMTPRLPFRERNSQ